MFLLAVGARVRTFAGKVGHRRLQKRATPATGSFLVLRGHYHGVGVVALLLRLNPRPIVSTVTSIIHIFNWSRVRTHHPRSAAAGVHAQRPVNTPHSFRKLTNALARFARCAESCPIEPVPSVRPREHPRHHKQRRFSRATAATGPARCSGFKVTRCPPAGSPLTHPYQHRRSGSTPQLPLHYCSFSIFTCPSMRFLWITSLTPSPSLRSRSSNSHKVGPSTWFCLNTVAYGNHNPVEMKLHTSSVPHSKTDLTR